MRAQRLMIAMALAMLSLPQAARAEVLLTPFAGVTFGSGGNSTGVVGGALTFMGAGIFGVELEAAYAPSFFDTTEFNFIDSDNVVTAMGNLIVGIPIGGTGGAGVKPYVTGGVGLMRTNVNTVGGTFSSVSNSDFGVNVGGGIIGFVGGNFGLRGDVRYFRSLSDPDEDLEFDIGLGDFDFWRGTFGLVFRF